jgi:hypothetical protein
MDGHAADAPRAEFPAVGMVEDPLHRHVDLEKEPLGGERAAFLVPETRFPEIAISLPGEVDRVEVLTNQRGGA